MSRYFTNIYQSMASIWVGMNITLKHMFTPAITLQYPDERWEMPERSPKPNVISNNAATSAHKEGKQWGKAVELL